MNAQEEIDFTNPKIQLLQSVGTDNPQSYIVKIKRLD